MRLKILSSNVRGLGSPSKVNLLCRELELLSYIFLLQESHVSHKSQVDSVERVWRGKCFGLLGLESRLM